MMVYLSSWLSVAVADLSTNVRGLPLRLRAGGIGERLLRVESGNLKRHTVT